MINKEKKDLKENVFIDNTTMKKLRDFAFSFWVHAFL